MIFFFFFSSRRRHTRCLSDWSSDVCSSDLRNDLAQFEKYAAIDPARSNRWQVIDGETVVGFVEDLRARSYKDATVARKIAAEIGRASCRERGESGEGAGFLKRKDEDTKCPE